jgi:hypothetical protein
MIRALGERYDGHPDLEWVDVSIVGFWGEGDGTHRLSDQTRVALLNAYLDSFKKTPLIFQPLNGDAPDPGLLVRGTPIAATWPDGTCNGEGPNMRHLGWRGDCIGDMGFWRADMGDWCHMYDLYPEMSVPVSGGVEKAPIALGSAVLSAVGSRNRATTKVVRTSSIRPVAFSTFNAKAACSGRWRPLVDEWLRRWATDSCASSATPPNPAPQAGLSFWWENKGVAPAYRQWPLAIRLKSAQRTELFVTDADIRTWLPGDVVYDSAVVLPVNLPEGQYDLELAIVEPRTRQPHVRLAVEGRQPDGWYQMGKLTVRENSVK